MDNQELFSKINEYKEHKNYQDILAFARSRVSRINPLEIYHAITLKYGLPYIREDWNQRESIRDFPVYGDVDFQSMEQMEEVTKIPGFQGGAILPDGHFGYHMPIGGVAAFEGTLFPAGVGVDIGCQVNLTMFQENEEEVDFWVLSEILQGCTAFGKGADYNKFIDKTPRQDKVMRDYRWQLAEKYVPGITNTAKLQLGTSGGGNHFADIVYDAANGKVGLLTHSGSRGAGAQIAKKFIQLAHENAAKHYTGLPSDLGWFRAGDTGFSDYYQLMNLMRDYAYANHKLIHETFTRLSGLTKEHAICSVHNLAFFEDGLYVHRKGATPLWKNYYGLIPGTCGSSAYVVEGLGFEKTYLSSSHGAGRNFSRSEAKRRFSQVDFDEAMEGILYVGVGQDESPHAYKDIEAVISHQEQEGILQRVAELIPVVVIMGQE